MRTRIFVASLFSIFPLFQTQGMDEKETILTVVNQLTTQVKDLTQQLNQMVINLDNYVKFTNTLTPIGAIMEYSSNAVVPNNWLECDGRAISRTDYAELLQLIGVTYGAGDQLNTFNIPDRRGRVAVGIGSDNSTSGNVTNVTAPNIALGQIFGEESHTLTVLEMPQHHHSFSLGYNGGTGGWIRDVEGATSGGGHPKIVNVTDAGDNASHNNMPPSIFMKFYIRAK